MNSNVSFKWSNYLAPTPRNLKAAVNAVKGLLVVFAGYEFFANNPKYSFWILIGSYALDQLAKFFGYVEEATKVITVEVPANADVKVSSEIKEPEL